MSDNNSSQKDDVVTPHPSAIKNRPLNITEEQGRINWRKRYMPALIAAGLSGLWILCCIGLFLQSDKILSRMPLYEIAGLMAGAMLPLVVIWLVTIVFLRSDPLREHRLMLSNGLDDLLSPLNVAQNRVEQIVADLHKEIKHIEAAGDIAEDRIKNLENRFQDQINTLFDTTTEAETKARDMQEILSTEREAFSGLVAEITEHVGEMETMFKQLKFDSETMASTSRKSSEKISNEITFQKKTLEDRARQIDERLEEMGKKLVQLASDVSSKTTEADQQVKDLTESITEQHSSIKQSVKSMTEETESICSQLDAQSKQISALNTQAAEDSAKINQSLKLQADELSSAAAGALAQTMEASEAFQSEAMAMSRSLNESSERSQLIISEATDHFAEKASSMNMLAENITENLNSHMDETTTYFKNQSEELNHTVNSRVTATAEALDKQADLIREGIKQQTTELDTMLEDVSQKATEKVSSTLEKLEEESTRISGVVENNNAKLDENSTLMAGYVESFAEKSGEIVEQFTKSRADMVAENETLLKQLKDAGSALDKATDQLKNSADHLGTDAQTVVEGILSQSDKLLGHVDDMRQKSEAAMSHIKDLDQDLTKQLSNTEDRSQALTDEWQKTADHIQTASQDTLNRIEEITQKLNDLELDNTDVVEQAEDKIKNISDQLQYASESIYLASASAIEAADETNNVIEQHNDKFTQLINSIQLSTKSILTDMESLEKRMNNKGTSGFSNLASKVIEQLQSYAIDISRHLEEEIPEDTWQLYLDGDKGTFVKRLKKNIDKRATQTIVEKYKLDREFRQHIDDYLHTFEELMSRAMASESNSPFSVALISSDTGKIYLALAQAVGRLAS